MLVYLIYILSIISTVNCYLASITSPCDFWIDDNVYVQPGNGTYVWLYDNSNITSTCNYTIQSVTYASLDLIQIYSSTIASVIIVSGIIFSCMLCYIISFWIERRSRNSRRTLRFTTY